MLVDRLLLEMSLPILREHAVDFHVRCSEEDELISGRSSIDWYARAHTLLRIAFGFLLQSSLGRMLILNTLICFAPPSLGLGEYSVISRMSRSSLVFLSAFNE